MVEPEPIWLYLAEKLLFSQDQLGSQHAWQATAMMMYQADLGIFFLTYQLLWKIKACI